jgi:phenylacetate-CoA ligase
MADGLQQAGEWDRTELKLMLTTTRKIFWSAAFALNRQAVSERAFFRKNQWRNEKDVRTLQEERLSTLLNHAAHHVPFYKRRLMEAGVFRDDKIHIEYFAQVPILSKGEVREHFDELKSDDLDRRTWYINKSGGSTGEPVTILQDTQENRISGGEVLRCFYEWHDAYPGDREINLWGSDRDLFHGSPPAKVRLRKLLSGTHLCNSFRMSPDLMRTYINTINKTHPKVLRGYVSSLWDMACFAESEGLQVRPPTIIISSAGKLHEPMRKKMEAIYGCRIYNHYGSRELHNIAMECPFQSGLHISAFTQFVEILDENNRQCRPGKEGRIVVTPLIGSAMPLVRYDTGDRGVMAEGGCSCGRGLPRLKEVTGRSVESFKTEDGRIIPGEFFIHLIGVLVDSGGISKFQVIQEDYHRMVVRLAMRTGMELTDNLRGLIKEKILAVMGNDHAVHFETVNDIPSLPSGKYSYTVCRIPEAGFAS